VFSTREPGGSPEADKIRAALLSGHVWHFGPFAEAVLFSVARKGHVDGAIFDELARGRWVVCDRFADSTRAYQGVTGGVPRSVINALERLTLRGLMPNLTFIFDIPAEEGLARAAQRLGAEAPDRFEAQDLASHERIRRAFLDIAEEEPSRCVVIDARKPEALVAEDVWEAVTERLRP
jgi:dTMP kinase